MGSHLTPRVRDSAFCIRVLRTVPPKPLSQRGQTGSLSNFRSGNRASSSFHPASRLCITGETLISPVRFVAHFYEKAMISSLRTILLLLLLYYRLSQSLQVKVSALAGLNKTARVSELRSMLHPRVVGIRFVRSQAQKSVSPRESPGGVGLRCVWLSEIAPRPLHRVFATGIERGRGKRRKVHVRRGDKRYFDTAVTS